jgi:hypothetical protein
MAQWIKSKLVMLIIGLVAVLATLGVGGVAAVQARVSNGPGVEDQQILGTIKSVNLATQNFALLPDGKQTTITIAFDAHTNIEGGSATLAAGTRVRVEVLHHPNGSLSATEINPSANNQVNQANRADNDVNDDRGGPDVNDDRGHDRGDRDANDDRGNDR